MNVKELTSYLKEKLKRSIEVVPPPKKDDGGGDKKEKEKEGGGGDKKGKEEKKEEKKEGGGEKKGGETKAAAGESSKGGDGPKVEVNKMEYHGLNNLQTHYATTTPMYNQSYYNQDYGLPMNHYQDYPPNYGYGNTGYVQYAHGPPPPPPTYMNTNMNMNDQMFSDENPNGCSVM